MIPRIMGLRSALIDEHQRLEVEPGLRRLPDRPCDRDVGLVLLAGLNCSFLNAAPASSPSARRSYSSPRCPAQQDPRAPPSTSAPAPPPGAQRSSWPRRSASSDGRRPSARRNSAPSADSADTSYPPCSALHRKSRPLRGSSGHRSEEHTSELQSLMRISYAVFCLKKKNTSTIHKKR